MACNRKTLRRVVSKQAVPMQGLSGVRSFLRLFPCRPEQRQAFRAQAVSYIRGQPTSPKLDALTREYEFHLRAQAQLKELNLRYFPQSGMTERELLSKIANRVGFKAPEWKDH
ncbi:MAG: hypothetical protein SGPRY_004395 [Prymnesium sp.]